jgi:hypothetical protein
VIAVGTTSVRSLESAARDGVLKAFSGDTDIFIYPGRPFHVVDCLVTNFHLPESTLLMLVSAFAAPFVFLSARKLAPTRPATAGLALGLATGGLAATAYGLLHCGEATVAFVATWYTLGIAAAGLIGAAVGRFALRW